MKYTQLRTYDVANGEGIRTTIFFSGCTHYCKGCFNQDYWDFNTGSFITGDTVDNIVDNLAKPQIRGLSVLGGEPLHPNNVWALASIVATIRFHYQDTKDIWIWSGYTLEELLNRDCTWTRYILSQIDVLVDGKYEEELKDFKLRFRGSSNQRIINMKLTRELGNINLYLK